MQYLDSRFIVCVGLKVCKQWNSVLSEIEIQVLDLSFRENVFKLNNLHQSQQPTKVSSFECDRHVIKVDPSSVITYPSRKMNDIMASFFLSHPCIARNSNLTDLDLSFHELGDVGSSIICNSKCMAHLKSLRLASNGITNLGFKQIIHSLYLKKLTLLQLHNNEISDEGVMELAKSEMFHRSLEYLDLSYNKIGDAGARALAHFDINSRVLSNMCQEQNMLQGKANSPTKTSTSLKLVTLVFTGNVISRQGSMDLERLLKKGLQVLYVESPTFWPYFFDSSSSRWLFDSPPSDPNNATPYDDISNNKIKRSVSLTYRRRLSMSLLSIALWLF